MRIINRLRKLPNEDAILKRVQSSHLIQRYFCLIIGILISSASYNLFFFKNNIVYGGVNGIAIITKNIINPSIFILIVNSFLAIISFIFLGKDKTINSVIGAILYPLFVSLTSNVGNFLKIDNDNLLLIVVFGGVLTGFASGLIYKSGFTTGGTDIINQILVKYLKISMGTASLLFDGLIVIAGGFFFGWTNVLYAMIVLYILNVVVDKVMLGISSSKAVYITTDKDEEIWSYLLNELNLGLTLIETRGGYSYKKDEMIMCVVSTKDYFKVREGVHEIDPKAVMLVTDAYQTYGVYGSKGSDISGVY